MVKVSSKNLEGSVESGERSIRDIFDFDMPDIKFTEETRKKITEYSKTCSCDVRLALGLFYTTEEYNALREKILSTPFP